MILVTPEALTVQLNIRTCHGALGHKPALLKHDMSLNRADHNVPNPGIRHDKQVVQGLVLLQ